MTAVDAYLERVERAMRGLDRTVRDDVIRELRSHLSEATAELGDAKALEGADAPAVVAARYRDLYGYGTGVQVILLLLAAFLAVPTLPLLLYAEAGTLVAFAVPLLALLGLVAFLFFVAVRGGSTLGLLAGLAAAASRFALLAVLAVTAGAVVPDEGGWAVFLLVSVLVILLGYLPGRARERWRPKDVTM